MHGGPASERHHLPPFYTGIASSVVAARTFEHAFRADFRNLAGGNGKTAREMGCTPCNDLPPGKINCTPREFRAAREMLQMVKMKL